MLANAAWFLVGLGALVVGSEAMVRGGAAVAARLGIRPLVVGLTVVSIGTSMPELAVGVVAAREGSGALAVGNIAGTNVVNLIFVLGLSALMLPLAVERRTIRFELPVMAGAAIMLWLLAADGVLSRIDGLLLVVAAIAYTVAVIRTARRDSGQTADDATPTSGGRALWQVVLTVAGIAIVVLGAEWLVSSAVELAREFGVTDAFIGLTVVAIGTSAPELVTTVVSTLRGNRDIAIGNLLGSSIYNILLILGITCLVATDGLRLTPALVRVDIPIMVAAALVCVPIFITGRRVGRVEGGAMVAAYLAYLAFLIVTQT